MIKDASHLICFLDMKFQLSVIFVLVLAIAVSAQPAFDMGNAEYGLTGFGQQPRDNEIPKKMADSVPQEKKQWALK